MKSRSIAVLVILLTAAPGLSGLAQAEEAVTNNLYEDSFPYIRGNHLVWQGRVDGDWEVFLYSITTKETTRLTTNNYDDVSPRTDGNYVVWLAFSDSGGEIFLYDIRSKVTGRITTDSNVDSSPQIANGLVVWTSRPVTDSVEPGNIFLYDTASTTTTLLSASDDPDNTLDDSSPRINDGNVVWVRENSDGTTTLFVHNLTDGSTVAAGDGFVWRESPQTHENLTVLTRHDGSDREVFAYNSDSRKYHQITANGFQDRYPSIGGNYVAWTSGGEIFLAGLPIMGRAATNVQQTSFTANWKAPAEGADSYRVDVSTAWNFNSCVAGYQNLEVGNTTSYVVTGLMPDTTYHYRVRAVLGGSTSTDSGTIRVVTPERGKVAGTILMLLVLDEDSQPDPHFR